MNTDKYNEIKAVITKHKTLQRTPSNQNDKTQKTMIEAYLKKQTNKTQNNAKQNPINWT